MSEHISHSQVGMFLRCPMQYNFRYEQGLKIAPSGPMHFGITFDDGLTANYEQKIESDKDLSPDDVTDVFLEKFDNDTQVDWKGEKPAEYREAGIKLTHIHLLAIAPHIQPKAVQVRATMKLKAVKKPVIVVPDLITRDYRVIDYKTTGKTPGKDAAGTQMFASEDHSRQLILYAIFHRYEYKVDAFTAEAQYHVRLKKTPKIVTASLVPTPAYQEYAVGQMARVCDAIEVTRQSGIWVPNRGGMMCSEKQCGYWKICHEQFGPVEEVNELKQEVDND